MEDISKLRQKISELNQKRWTLLQRVMSPGKLLTASFYERSTKCGNANCKCANGDLHGPFWWIYQKRKGQKLISTSCASSKVEDAKQFSENYKQFKTNWAQIQEIDVEINKLISQIESVSEVEIKEFTRKEGEKRVRKQKESSKSIKREEN